MNAFDVHAEVGRLGQPVQRPGTMVAPARPGVTSDAVMTALPSSGAVRAHRRRRLRHALAVRAASAVMASPEHFTAEPPPTSGRADDGRALTDTQAVVSTAAVGELYASLMSSRRSARQG